MKKYIPWLRWWLLFVLITFGTTILAMTGVLQRINDVDITRISYIIYAVFIYFSIRTGMDTYIMCNVDVNEEYVNKKLLDSNKIGWFVSNVLLTLGMIGTVVGFIYMLTSCFMEITPDDIGSMKSLISKMSVGMGTALYTTAVGLICSLLLRLQLFNVSHYVQSR